LWGLYHVWWKVDPGHMTVHQKACTVGHVIGNHLLDFNDAYYEPFAYEPLLRASTSNGRMHRHAVQARTEPPGLGNESILSGHRLENPNLPG
jgi:hypothetical protein